MGLKLQNGQQFSVLRPREKISSSKTVRKSARKGLFRGSTPKKGRIRILDKGGKTFRCRRGSKAGGILEAPQHCGDRGAKLGKAGNDSSFGK